MFEFYKSKASRIIAFILAIVLTVPLISLSGMAAEKSSNVVAAEKSSNVVAAEKSSDGAAGNKSSAQVSWRDYDGKKIGIITGTPLETIASEYFPHSEYLYFESYPDLSAALLAGKIDAFLADEPNIKMMHNEQCRCGTCFQ